MRKLKQGKELGAIDTLYSLLEMFYDRGNHYEFRTMQQELAVPGELRSNTSFDFEFRNVEKQYESYHGINVKLRYERAFQRNNDMQKARVDFIRDEEYSGAKGLGFMYSSCSLR
jgi:hypothetical protein